MMPFARKDIRGGGSFTTPLLGVVFLLACYLVLADWQDVPRLIDGALASINFSR